MPDPARDWSPQQVDAIEQVQSFLHDPNRQIFRLFGYAGTGKTTLMQELLGGVSGGIAYAAYTGKAASVMRKKGCYGASTLHSLAYKPLSKAADQLESLELELKLLRLNGGTKERIDEVELLAMKERENLERPDFALNWDSALNTIRVLGVDECSMVDENMGGDLASFPCKILALGDPAQLPPVGGGGFFTECEPDVMLTEIHRQAQDNPIIYLATRARNNERLLHGEYGESAVKIKASEEDLLGADQILCGRNRTRKAINARMRGLKGFENRCPIVGEKLVCLRNNKRNGLMNGTIWEVVEREKADAEFTHMTVKDDEGRMVRTKAWSAHFLDTELPRYDQRKMADEFDFGYALTVHKSQGSQWDSVLLVDEGGAFDEDAWRWRYTGLTRAAERIIVTSGQ